MSKIEGPKYHLNLEISCNSCQHLQSEYYFVEDGNSYDSGFDNFCTKILNSEGKPSIMDSSHKTPPWCPFLKTSRQELETLADLHLRSLI